MSSLRCHRTVQFRSAQAVPKPRAPVAPFLSPSLLIPRAAADESSLELSSEREAELRQSFKAADANGDGCIDRDELWALLESTSAGSDGSFREWLPEEDVNAVLKRYDLNENGQLEWEEFKALAEDNQILTGKLSEYRAAFNAVDTSGNGAVGATELASLFQQLQMPVSYSSLLEVMQKYDVDESGQIEFNEFLRMFRDQLLDLSAVLAFISNAPAAPDDGSSVRPIPRALPEMQPGEVVLIFSSEELDEILDAAAKKGALTVVMAALTWCRPCKAVQRPFMKLALAYSGTTFVKFYGNANDSTRALFKDVIQARASPAFAFFRDGKRDMLFTGANRLKLEDNLRKNLPDDQKPVDPIFD